MEISRMGDPKASETIENVGKLEPDGPASEPAPSSAARGPVEDLMDALPDAVVVVGADGLTRYANPPTLVLLGQTAEAVVGQPFRFPVSPGQLLAVKVPAPPGTDDDEARYGEMRTSPLTWHGEPCVLAVIRDVTEQRRAEEALQKAERQIREKHRLEAVGQLAGGVAHDFNNLMAIVLSYANLALDTLAPDHPLRPDMTEVRVAAERASELTRQLLAFSRRQIMVPRVVDLNHVLRDIEKIVAKLLGRGVELSMRLEPDLGPVIADAAQFEQIVMNLVVNARDAMPQGGRITIETANGELDEAYAEQQQQLHEDVTAGPHVVVSVLDTGVGMDPQTCARVFEPFFTTRGLNRGAGQGSGLGLSVVYGIVRQLGGHVRVYSEPGTGTMFRLYVPRAEAADVVKVPAALGARARAAATLAGATSTMTPPLATSGHETVLLVEDDDQVRALVKTVLRRSGYVVLEASGAPEAIELCEAHAGDVDLLLSDVEMPKMNGRELATVLLRRRPAMRALLFSGYGGEPPRRPDDPPIHGFLEKPITPESLLEKVRQTLDG
jgi:signal transduction histidine kinase